MSRFYDAVDESLSLISARSPSPSGVAGRQAAGSRQQIPSDRQLGLRLLWSSSYNVCESFASASGVACQPACLPCVCGRYSLYSWFLCPYSASSPPSSCPAHRHSFGFLIYAQFNLRFLFYLKLIIYYFFLLRFLLAFGN